MHIDHLFKDNFHTKNCISCCEYVTRVSSFVNSSPLTTSNLVLMWNKWTFLYVIKIYFLYVICYLSYHHVKEYWKQYGHHQTTLLDYVYDWESYEEATVISKIIQAVTSGLQHSMKIWWAIQLFQDYLEAWLLLLLSSQKRDIEPFVSSVAFFFKLV